MFFWVIVTCHAEWMDCQFDPQPDFSVCMQQAVQINENTDGIAVCTTRKSDDGFAPEAWAMTPLPRP